VISLLPSPDVFDRGVDQLFRHFDCTTAVQVHG
jgi:hypothetical protein